jgi:transcriptional regulator with XRE-family HTH domain
MTQKQLSEKAGITEAAISHYIKGNRVPRASVLGRLAIALNTTTDYLLEGITPDAKEELGYAKKLIVRNVILIDQRQLFWKQFHSCLFRIIML